MTAAPALLELQGLDVERPGGGVLLADVCLQLREGEIVALLGGSGAGKSTLVSALHEPDKLRKLGFSVRTRSLDVRSPVGLVPQRGALFDHLSVAGNLALALRNAESVDPSPESPAQGVAARLDSVDLPRAWAASDHAVGGLSGGEAQRLSVARTLAGGRRILFMDEPSVGLDPLRAADLADLLRAEIRQRDAAALVITHELEFAAGIADRFLYMDRVTKSVVELDVDVPSADIPRTQTDRRRVASALGDQVLARLSAESKAPLGVAQGPSVSGESVGQRILAPFALVPRILGMLPQAARRGRDFLEVFWVALKQALLRPAGFFGIVSVLIGFTLLYILHRSLGGGEMPIRSDRVFGLIGSMHIIALAPALSGILFAATSANALTAWLGGMSLTRQTVALQGLGISPARYLWLPSFVGLVLAYVVLSAVFVLGMCGGGTLYLAVFVPDLPDAWMVVTADLADPPADRLVFRTRALVLFGLYAVGIAADAIAKGSVEKRRAEDVTVAMVRSVMAVTLWIVGLELLTLMYVYGVRA